MSQRTREELIASLRESQREVSALLESMADVQDWQREPAEWSFRYLAAYLAAVEYDCYLPRVSRIASGNNPHLDSYMNGGLDYSSHELRDSLNRWSRARREVIDLVCRLTDDELAFTATHDTYGVLTVLDALEDIAIQDQGHIRHIMQLIEDYYDESPVRIESCLR